jgi:hypothetical protein
MMGSATAEIHNSFGHLAWKYMSKVLVGSPIFVSSMIMVSLFRNSYLF